MNLLIFRYSLGTQKVPKRFFEKHLKLFNLNSMNLNAVLLALNEEGYEKILPLASGQHK